MKHLFTLLVCAIFAQVCAAQTEPVVAPVLSVDSTTTLQTTLPSTPAPAAAVPEEVFRRNSIKMNLSSLAFSNYSFSYERAIARKITLTGGYSFLPETKAGSIPLINKAAEIAGVEDDEVEGDEVAAILDEANVASKAITGEIRFYTGKKPGARGFYASVYGRYTTMKLSHLYSYESELGYSKDLPMDAKLTGFGGGVMLGAQWLIAKRVTFDWYLIGGHYGKLSGDFTSKTDLSAMPQEDKAELEAEIEDIGSNGDRKYIDATVNNSGMFGKVSSPFAGIRGLGFNIGIAF